MVGRFRRIMKARKILYVCSGVFNCVIGGLGFLLGLLFLLLNKFAKQMFSGSGDFINSFVRELVAVNSKYEYLIDSSKDEIVSFIMRIVFILSVVFIVLGLIWIAFGVFNCILFKRHDLVFGRRPVLKILFVVASWILLTLNVANITTTIAVFLKDKNNQNTQPLYSSGHNN